MTETKSETISLLWPRSLIVPSELQGYNHSLLSYLIEGFTYGFKLGCVGEPTLSIHKNHNSVNQNPTAVQAKMSTELSLGRISEPFVHVPFHNYICSP